MRIQNNCEEDEDFSNKLLLFLEYAGYLTSENFNCNSFWKKLQLIRPQCFVRMMGVKSYKTIPGLSDLSGCLSKYNSTVLLQKEQAFLEVKKGPALKTAKNNPDKGRKIKRIIINNNDKRKKQEYFAKFPGFYTLFKVEGETPKTFEDYLDILQKRKLNTAN